MAKKSRQDAPGGTIAGWQRESYGVFFEKILLLDFDDPGEGGDNDSAVVGLALRFALSARPTGSQGFAPGKANHENKNKNQEQGQKQEQRQQQRPTEKGTFPMR